MSIVAERAFTARATLQRIEAGEHSVSIGIYASVLHALGLLEELGEIADLSRDSVGQMLAAAELPVRAHPRRQGPNSVEWLRSKSISTSTGERNALDCCVGTPHPAPGTNEVRVRGRLTLEREPILHCTGTRPDARPKASVLDRHGHLSTTKLPEVAKVTRAWRDVAGELRAAAAEIERMSSAFEHDDLAKALAL